jgi:signal transduction histidine kinase
MNLSKDGRRRLDRLDPRLHVTAAIGWAVMSVVTLAAAMAASLAAAQAEQRARADAEGRLAEYATQVRDALSMNLEMRSLALQMSAVQLRALAGRDSAEQVAALRAVKSHFAEFDGLCVTDQRGRVSAAAGEWRRGADLAAQAWYESARSGAVVRDQPILTSTQAGPAGPRPQAAERELVFAVPLATDRPGGVLAAVMPLTWVDGLLTHMQQILGKSQPLELMLASREGIVFAGPAHWRGRSLREPADLTEAGGYLVGRRTQLRLADSLGLGWTAVVRQPAEQALAPVRSIRQTVFAIVFLAGLLSAFAAVLATRALLRRLAALAQQASSVEQGRQDALAVPAGSDEVARIGATLAQLVDRLQGEKKALQALNAELDARVAQRTARIERLADEARLAAVSRERLRLARDLHDTLAHSLMALLTQIRLVRKLHARLAPAQLDEELGQAEQVAASGLAEARAAIAQMRSNSVREVGLGAAVRDLAQRFAQRSGLKVNLVTDPAAQGWVDERFEAVFRIVEESLRNIERHAGASQVSLVLALDPAAPAAPGGVADGSGRARIEVIDDGCGFDTAGPHPGHFGLRGMREQATLIGAQIGIDSSREGSRVRVTLEV